MKGISKFFSAAAAVLALASCSSDDLNFSNNAPFSGKGDLIGSLENATRAGVVDGGDMDNQIVWSEGDAIQVYTPNVLKFNSYLLKDGAGTQNATFDLVAGTEDNIGVATATDLYAVYGESIYGVSATADGGMKLTVKVPQEFEWQKLAFDANTDYYVNPQPVWGSAAYNAENGQIAVGFQPLMSTLKVDVALLKKDTKALLLVSKSAKQPLSGTFNAVLTNGCKLGADEELVNYQVIRVNTETMKKDANKVFYIPVIAQTYDEMQVIGVINDDGDDNWDNSTPSDDCAGNNRGTLNTDYYVIEDLKNVTFNNGRRRTLARMVQQDVEASSLYDLSQKIATLMDGVHAVNVNVKTIAVSDIDAAAKKGKLFNSTTAAATTNMNDDKVLYIANDIPGDIKVMFSASISNDIKIIEAPTYLDADGKIQFKLPNVTATSNEELDDDESYSYYYDEDASAVKWASSAAKARTVTIDLLATAADATDKKIDAYLPTTNLVIKTHATTPGTAYGQSAAGAITAITANTCTIDNENSAAGLTLQGNFFQINSAAENAGGIVISGEGTEVITNLNINNPAQGTSWVKLEDASATTITYVAQATETFIYTTGASSIATLTETTTDKVGVRSYWTGKKAAAPQATIFTAGQLAAIDNSIDSYSISDKVSFIHLGGKSYPWVGADVTPGADFTFDGNNRPLQSMKLAAKDLTDAAIISNNGLFRQINNAGKAVTIKGIDMWDVLSDGVKCDNVGAIAGKVAASTLTLGAASKPINVKYVQLNANGENIGGLFGNADLTGALTTANTVTLTGKSIKATGDKGNNVGGLFGTLKTSAAVTLNTQNIKVQNYTNNTTLTIAGSGNNVAGLIGNLDGTSAAVSLGKVAVKAAAINGAANVGGLVGNYNAAALTASDASVEVPEIKGTDANVAGLFGLVVASAASTINKVSVKATTGISGKSNVGGLVAYSEINGGVTMAAGAAANPIVVEADLTADDENVGGLIANAYVGNVTISNTGGTKNSIKVAGKLTGAYAVGGLVGMSTVAETITGIGSSTVSGIDLSGVTFENSWAADKFNTPTLKLYCGSFAYVVGYVKGNVTLTAAAASSSKKAGIALPTAPNATARKALHFDVNKGNETTAGDTFGFWGQEDMSIGYVNTGNITVNAEPLTAGTEYNVYDDVY